jgi:hypothetical protein
MCARSTVCKMYIMDLFIFKHNVIHAFNVYIAAFTNCDAISKFYAFNISASTHSRKLLTSRIPGMSLRSNHVRVGKEYYFVICWTLTKMRSQIQHWRWASM